MSSKRSFILSGVATRVFAIGHWTFCTHHVFQELLLKGLRYHSDMNYDACVTRKLRRHLLLPAKQAAELKLFLDFFQILSCQGSKRKRLMNSCCVRWSAAWNFSAKMSLQASQRFSLGKISSRTILARKLRFRFLVKKTCSLTNTSEDEPIGFNELQNLKTFAWCRFWVCEFAVMLLRSIILLVCIWRLHKSSPPVFTFSPFIIARRRERSGFIVSCSLQKRKKCNEHVTNSEGREKTMFLVDWKISDGNLHNFLSFCVKESR